MHYFSGTGNTYRVVSIVRRKLEESGYGVHLVNIEETGGITPAPSDLDVFAFPVYAMDVPDIMVSHIRRLPRVNGRIATVIAVHGKLVDRLRVPGDVGDPGYSHGHAYMRLKMKGYDVFFTDAVGYPHNVTMLLTAASPAEQKLIMASSDKRVEEFAERIAAGKRSLRKCGVLAILYSAVPGLVFRIFGRRGLGKLYVADTACTKYGKCVKDCPVKAVRLTLGRPRWSWKCQGCQRCINACPNRAIQLSLFRAGAMFGGLFLPLNAWAFMLLPLGIFSPHAGTTGVIFDIAVWFILYLAALYVLDKAFFILEAVPILGKIMSLNLSSPNLRYLEPSFKTAMGDDKSGERERPV